MKKVLNIVNSLKTMNLIFIGVSLLFVVCSFFLPFVKDYPQYSVQWERLLNGVSLYSTPSGKFKMFWYGPLHNIFALPYAVHPNLPRLLFFGSWAFSAYLLLRLYIKPLQKFSAWIVPLVLVFSFLNPYTFRMFFYGQNDLMVGALLFFAVYLHYKRRNWLAALFFVLAFTYKLYPIILMPYFFYNNQHGAAFQPKRFFKHINWQFVSAFLVFVALTMGIQYAIYGEYGLRSYFYVLDRKPTSSSLYYFLTEVAQLQIDSRWSIITALVGLFTLLGLYVFNLIDRYAGMIMAILILFITSRVFYFSYELSFLLILPFYKYAAKNEGEDLRILGYFIIIAAVFAANIIFKYALNMPLRDYKGLIYLIPNLYLFGHVLRFTLAKSHARSTSN